MSEKKLREIRKSVIPPFDLLWVKRGPYHKYTLLRKEGSTDG